MLFCLSDFFLLLIARLRHLHIFVEISPKRRKRCSNERRKSYVPSIKKTIHSTSISHGVKSPKYWQQQPPLQPQHHRRQLLKNRCVRPQAKKPPNWKSTVVCRIHRLLQPIQTTICILMNQHHQCRTKVMPTGYLWFTLMHLRYQLNRIKWSAVAGGPKSSHTIVHTDVWGVWKFHCSHCFSQVRFEFFKFAYFCLFR